MAKVVINKPAMLAFLNTNPGAQAGLATNAELTLKSVDEMSPTGTRMWQGWLPRTDPVGPIWSHGWFKKSLRLKKYRAHWRVESTDKSAHIVEWGSVTSAPYAPFRRTIRRFHGTESVTDDS